MRKFIITGLMAAVALPASLQAAPSHDVRQDARDYRQEVRELAQVQRNGSRADVREERRDVREAGRDLRQSANQAQRRYHAGAYVAPRGMRLRSAYVGQRIATPFLANRYVIANPARYGLPPTRGVTRWIRHGNDALLVNIRTGAVLRVHRRLFA